MLTYNQNSAPKRKDRPWLLVILVIIWIIGAAVFHSPWEPHEPFVFAVVKGIIYNHSWLVPYISGAPYLQIQPFYFWLYSAIIKLFNIHNIYSIANSVRVVNILFTLSVIALSAKIGSNLLAYKNGRTVVLVLISSVGFINNSYQLTPNMIVLLGFCLYIYSLQLYQRLPGISGWILFVGLLLISIHFTCEFILIALLILAILPLIDKHWRNKDYLITVLIGVSLFAIIFYLYSYQLQSVNKEFFLQWKQRYTALYNVNHKGILKQLLETVSLLLWYLVPSWTLAIWTFYKHRKTIFKDKIIQVNVMLVILLFLVTLISGKSVEGMIFPIILPFTFIASIAIDSMRISIVALFNWFCIFLFGIVGIGIWIIYFGFIFRVNNDLLNRALQLSQDFVYNFNIWQLMLAVIITLIWVFMITRRHIRGREMVTNWASGTTFVLVLFMALLLPWFDSILTFKPIVTESLKHLDLDACVATNGENTPQGALWYYYADVNLMPSFININYSICNQALVATRDIHQIDQNIWQIIWQANRPIDNNVYYVLKRR